MLPDPVSLADFDLPPLAAAPEPPREAADLPPAIVALLLRAQSQLRAGEAAAAAACCRQVLAQDAGQADACNLLALALSRTGRIAEALPWSRRAVAAQPGNLRLRVNHARRLVEAGRGEEAARLIAPVLGRLDAAAGLLAECGSIAARAQQWELARDLYRRALDLHPETTAWWHELARLAVKRDDMAEGIEACEQVLAATPLNSEARIILAAFLFRRGDYPRMREVLHALEVRGMDAANAANLSGLMMVGQGLVEEGLAAMRLVEDLAPQASQLQMTRVMYLNYDPTLGAGELFAAHRAFGRRFAGAVAPLGGRFAQSAEPERPLRIGYLSPDFRAHSVAYFMAPIFKNFDRARFATIGYAQVRHPDGVTAELRREASGWRDVTALDDRALAACIRDDRIDILVDLAGYTADSRLLALTGRPAPVQISYLGYPNTTGLPQIDYRITDGIADPDDADDHYTERLIRLPRCFLCYAFATPPPAIKPPPFERNGHITFGSFNSLCKVNGAVIRLWARVLQAVPDARLMLKSVASGHAVTQDHLRARFAEHGVAPERLQFASYQPSLQAHLELYNEIDLALDTTPYNGTTTTCEALWMGVPVLTLRGDRHAARVGASLLSAIGFTAGIAQDEQEFVMTARLMAEHPELIRAARGRLRQDMVSSPLCAGAEFTASLEEALRAVWRLWCAEQA